MAVIAEMIGVAPTTLSDIFNGRTTSPRGDAALKLDELHRSRLHLINRKVG